MICFIHVSLELRHASSVWAKLFFNKQALTFTNSLTTIDPLLWISINVVERLDSTNKQKCAYTSAYVHPHASVYTCICIHIHRHTYIHIHTYAHSHIHAYMHTHMHMHVYAHLYKHRISQQQRLNASINIIDAHTYPYTYACAYIYICTYTYVHTLQRVCHRCVRWCPTNTCITYTSARELVPRTPVPTRWQHSLQKKCAYTYTYTRMHTHTYAHKHACTSTTLHHTPTRRDWDS